MHDPKPAAPPPPPDPFERHTLDLQAIRDGKWVEIHGDRFLVAKLGTAETARARAEALAELGLPADGETPAKHVEAVSRAIFVRQTLRDAVFANKAPFTREVAERIWDDEELVELRQAILREAQGDYRRAVTHKAAVLGN